jgi:hypothetical protein
VVVDNNMITALNKIAYNTYATAYNTDVIARFNADVNNTTIKNPVYGQGGLIGGNLHSQGGTHIEAERGEFIVNRFAASALRPFMEDINRGRLPVIPAFSAANDNFALVALVRSLLASNERLERELASFRKENGVNIMRGAQHVGEKVEETTEAVDGQTTKLAGEEQMNRRRAGSRR